MTVGHLPSVWTAAFFINSKHVKASDGNEGCGSTGLDAIEKLLNGIGRSTPGKAPRKGRVVDGSYKGEYGTPVDRSIGLVDLDNALQRIVNGKRSQKTTSGTKRRPGRKATNPDSWPVVSCYPDPTDHKPSQATPDSGLTSSPDWSEKGIDDIHRETLMRLTHIRDCMHAIEGPEAAEVERSLTALLRDLQSSNSEVQDRCRSLAELAISAREESQRVTAEEMPRERARLKELEDELSEHHSQRLQEVNVAWEAEKRKIDVLADCLQQRLAELGVTEDAPTPGANGGRGGLVEDGTTEKLLKENTELKLEVARMRKLHQHANQMHVESQLEVALMSSMLADRKRSLEDSEDFARRMDETARMTREELEAVAAICGRLSKTLDIVDRNIIQRGLCTDVGMLRRGTMGNRGESPLEVAAKAGNRLDNLKPSLVSKSLTHKYLSQRYTDSFGFKTVAPDDLPRPMTAGKEGGITKIVEVFCRRLNERRANSIIALPEPLPWMIRRPSIQEVFEVPSHRETMSLDLTRDLCHRLMDGWAVDALAVVGDFSQKTIGFPEFAYQFVMSERMEGSRREADGSPSLMDYFADIEGHERIGAVIAAVEKYREGDWTIMAAAMMVFGKGVDTDACLAYHSWRYMIHQGPHSPPTEYLNLQRVRQCIFSALPLASSDLLADIFDVLSGISAIYNDKDKFPAGMLLRLLMEEYLVERHERMVSLVAMADVSLGVAQTKSLTVGQVGVLVRTFFPSCPMGHTGTALFLSREAMRIHPEGLVDAYSLRVAVEEANLMCHQLVVHLLVPGRACSAMVAEKLEELRAVVGRALENTSSMADTSYLALLSSTTAINKIITLQQLLKLYAESMVAITQTALYLNGKGTPEPGLMGSVDTKVMTA
ncbi:hypothetical protein FOL46_005969 [Perkinsus olseni]|uniref:Uncharacterized protein n=1 Tax=Perkinsus olseni TaxID=32597 RepID=A0A7J6LPK0_PEROL|nr:hypothetical protein FOL46_005969 [Perkinsus olseni]